VEDNIMKNIINHEEIYEKLQNIFSNRFEIDLESIAKENFDKHLLGSDFRLAPRNLVYIYLDIEKDFGISIPDEDVATGGLNTINKIIEMVYRQLHKTEKAAV
jgi:peptide maturation system acyl carrier-related protein